MENVLMGNVPGSQEFGPAPVETKPPIDNSPPQPVDAPPFPGGGDGIVAEENRKAPTQPGGETPTDQTDDTSEPAPAMNNTLLIAGGLALLYFLFKRKK